MLANVTVSGRFKHVPPQTVLICMCWCLSLHSELKLSLGEFRLTKKKTSCFIELAMKFEFTCSLTVLKKKLFHVEKRLES